jgi:cell wall-associated NlpC family hydrolase
MEVLHNMNKFSAMLMAFAVAAPLVLPAAAGAAGIGSGEIQSTVSFRTSPSTSSNVIRYLHEGDDVTILEKVNSYWYKIQDSRGSVGYVSSLSKYIDVANPGASGQNASIASNAEIVSSVSFRTAPSTGASRIRYLQAGERVQVIGQPNAYWYQVKDAGGTVGYVSTSPQYINANAGQAQSGSTDQQAGTGQPASSAVIENVIAAGMKYLGTPYEFGSDRSTTTTFDCSDFVRTAFREGAGITLPTDSRGQGSYVRDKGAAVWDWHQLKRGDLIFFGAYRGSSASSYSGVNKATERITHVGIYLGDGKVLHTYSQASGGVRMNGIAGTSWEYRFLFGGSAL